MHLSIYVGRGWGHAYINARWVCPCLLCDFWLLLYTFSNRFIEQGARDIFHGHDLSTWRGYSCPVSCLGCITTFSNLVMHFFPGICLISYTKSYPQTQDVISYCNPREQVRLSPYHQLQNIWTALFWFVGHARLERGPLKVVFQQVYRFISIVFD